MYTQTLARIINHSKISAVSRLTKARIANVAMELVVFMSPIRIAIEAWTNNPTESAERKVVDAVFVYVAIDGAGRIRKVPR